MGENNNKAAGPVLRSLSEHPHNKIRDFLKEREKCGVKQDNYHLALDLKLYSFANIFSK